MNKDIEIYASDNRKRSKDRNKKLYDNTGNICYRLKGLR